MELPMVNSYINNREISLRGINQAIADAGDDQQSIAIFRAQERGIQAELDFLRPILVMANDPELVALCQ